MGPTKARGDEHQTCSRIGTRGVMPVALAFFCASSLVMLLGAVVGRHYVTMARHRAAKETDLIGCFTAWDATWYARLARDGYYYNPETRSNVIFFSAFPLAGKALARVTGWRMDITLLVISQVFALAAFVVGALYLEQRWVPRKDSKQEPGAATTRTKTFALLAFAFFPTTFYFHVPYTESLFVLLVILILSGIERHWPLWALAAVVGLATATRPTGVALLVPFAWHLWWRSRTLASFFAKGVLLAPVAAWGLIAYMCFLQASFGDPLAFVKVHKHWQERPRPPLAEKLWLDVTLEPVEAVYEPSSECYDRHASHEPNPFVSMYFANPVYFLIFAGLVTCGALNGWRSSAETLTGASLLLRTCQKAMRCACVARVVMLLWRFPLTS